LTNNGHQELKPIGEAPSTRRLWSDMLGLGDLFRVLSDPGLIAHVHAMMTAVMEAAAANKRIEEKLDRLLAEREADAARVDRTGAASLPFEYRADGTGRTTFAGGVADDGNRIAADETRGADRQA